MRLGSNWSYDGSTGDTRDIFAQLTPDSVVIMSHAAGADYVDLCADHPSLEFTIRAKTGPGHLGTYPSDILDYREWDTERSLRDAIEYLAFSRGFLRVILGNEPDIEMAVEPVDDRQNTDRAIKAYWDWWFIESNKIREAFPGVQLSPAPLSQGSPDRFKRWTAGLLDVYRDADFIACHCYIPMGEDPKNWGDQWKWFRQFGKPICITEMNDNGQYGSLNDEERAARYKAYIEQVAATGEVDEIDVFTLPGGAQDASAPSWWFITPEMADVIATADRAPAPPIIIDPIEPEPVEVTPMTEDEALNRALVDVWNGETMRAPYNPESAIVKFWREHIDEMGSALGPEYEAISGVIFQAFSRGVWKATPGDPWTVEKAA